MGNSDYIDTVVLVQKPDTAESAIDQQSAGKPEIPNVKDMRLTRVSNLEINSLTIDESLDAGGDPYNSTGKHCVLKIK